MMGMKSMMIDLQITRTNPYLQAVMDDQYIKMYENEVAQTIEGQKDINEIKKK